MIHQQPSTASADAVEVWLEQIAAAALIAGWGRCRSCDCMGFKDTGEDFRICAGCGHNWTEHR